MKKNKKEDEYSFSINLLTAPSGATTSATRELSSRWLGYFGGAGNKIILKMPAVCLPAWRNSNARKDGVRNSTKRN